MSFTIALIEVIVAAVVVGRTEVCVRQLPGRQIEARVTVLGHGLHEKAGAAQRQL